MGAQLRLARLDASLSLREVGHAVGLSHGWLSRIERGRASDLGLVALSELAAIVGLDVSVKAYPVSSPLRDAGQLALLERLRTRTSGFRWDTEVPVDRPGDLRAWDAMLRGAGVRIGVEAETRPRDAQALDRRIQLKLRDSLVDHVILLVAATRSNRAVLRELRLLLGPRFPIPPGHALDALANGRDPGGSSIIAL